MSNNFRASSSRYSSEDKKLNRIVPEIWFQPKVRVYAFYLPLSIAVMLLLTLLFVPSNEENVSGMVYFLGRFHPLIIHFPIVLVVLVFVFELLSRFTPFKISSSVTMLLLMAAVVLSVVSVIAGFLLYYTGEYTGTVMLWHKWAGIGVGVGILVATLLFLIFRQVRNPKLDKAYLFVLAGTNLLLLFASHQGGSLTHGTTYLTEYMPQWFSSEGEVVMKPVEEMIIYEDIVVTFLDAKCMSCHNENKTKGDLLMTTYQGLVEGGKSEMPVLVPHEAENSGIYHRVTLPEDDDDHMPPEGKAPLSEEEKFILKWWISEGASPTLTVQEAQTDSVTRQMIDAYTAELTNLYFARQNRQRKMEELLAIAADMEKELGIVVQPDQEYGGEYLAVSMAFPPTAFGDNELARLSPLFSNISKISLVGSNITDDGLYHIGKMSPLKELILQQTDIKGSGLSYLTQLNNLSVLNLSKTKIDDAEFLHIMRIPSLQTVYLNQTEVSPALLEAFQKNNPNLRIQLDRGEYF